MGARLHSHKLLALVVFVDSFKKAYVRSVHVLEEHIGYSFAIQQDFLFDPGKYRKVTGPIRLDFHAFLATVGLKQSIQTLIKMQQNEGWHCLLDYRSDAPSETSMSHILMPSMNVDLKDVPSLEQDLKVVENSVLSYFRVFPVGSRSLSVDGNTMATPKQQSLVWLSPSASVSSTSPAILCTHSRESVLPPETTKRVLDCQQFNTRHNWGSDLELASPKASLQSISSSDAQPVLANNQPWSRPFIDLNKSSSGHGSGSSWNPRMMLDLNQDVTEVASEEKDLGCALLLSIPAVDPKPLSTLEPGKQSPSLQQTITSDDSMESSADSNSSYENAGVSLNAFSVVELNTIQNVGHVCSEDSVSYHGSVLNASSSEVNGNSSTTSSAVYSPHGKSTSEGLNMEVNGVAYGALPLTAYHKNAGVKRHGKQSRAKACSNGSMQSMQPWMRNVNEFKSKPRSVRPGSTSERLIEITLQDLSQYFSMPIELAAKKLNVGLTVLKKRCREFNIPRWPHRKMKSLNCLIYNFQDLADDQGVRSSQRVLNTVRELEEQKKLMEQIPGVELADRIKKLRQACFKANYKKRRLGMMGNKNINSVCSVPPPASVLPVSPSAAPCPFGIMDLNPPLSTISSPQSCVSNDHFL